MSKNPAITLPAKLHARVEKAARALETTAQDFITHAVEAHLHRVGLHTSNRSDNLSAMHRLQAARVRHSIGSQSGKHDPLVLAANKAHHTLRSLAAVLGCSQPALTRARHGEISIQLARAKQIESICGFKATPGNWPRLRADETKQEGRKIHGRKPTKKTRPEKGAR
jgi:hypothetical protein